MFRKYCLSVGQTSSTSAERRSLKKTFNIPSTIEEIHIAIVESKSSEQYNDTYLRLNTIEILESEDDNNDVADEEVSANGASNPDCTENSSANQIAQKEYPRHANLFNNNRRERFCQQQVLQVLAICSVPGNIHQKVNCAVPITREPNYI